MGTRIFRVEYWYQDKFKNEVGTSLRGEDRTAVNVVATNALTAIEKAKQYQQKECRGQKSTLLEFDPINVTLEAEAD